MNSSYTFSGERLIDRTIYGFVIKNAKYEMYDHLYITRATPATWFAIKHKKIAPDIFVGDGGFVFGTERGNDVSGDSQRAVLDRGTLLIYMVTRQFSLKTTHPIYAKPLYNAC